MKEKCCGGKKCKKLTASQVIMKEKEDSLEKTKAELNTTLTEEEENEKVEKLLRDRGIGNYREGSDPT